MERPVPIPTNVLIKMEDAVTPVPIPKVPLNAAVLTDTSLEVTTLHVQISTNVLLAMGDAAAPVPTLKDPSSAVAHRDIHLDRMD